MNNVMEFKGYVVSVEFSAEDEVFFGKLTGIREVVTFEGDSVTKLKKAFKDAVEDYIITCRHLGKEPDTEFKGSFNARVKPKVHRLAVMRSAALKMSLNQFVEKAIEQQLS
jgi:predicted HicB family RNase H-like nuclease